MLALGQAYAHVCPFWGRVETLRLLVGSVRLAAWAMGAGLGFGLVWAIERWWTRRARRT